MCSDFKKSALDYHRYPTAGKIAIETTKDMHSQRDLSLAYSPGVAAVCEAIREDPDCINDYTARGNLVAVITNGTAVLGLGNIGPLAAKPVMEGKAALFKAFAHIDVFDIEVDASDPDRFVEVVTALAPSFGGINLEDIKAPECFEIERRLIERLDIPVFHDDQHGTAVCVAAAVRNGLRLTGKALEEVRLVCSGAGAAALSCLDLLVSMGLDKNRVTVCDRRGVIYPGREGADDPYKSRYARETGKRTLKEAMAGADVFLGVSAPGLIDGEDVRQMADHPLILALANPDPEITPEEVEAVRSDALMATGRSDYPNQVNNVLCFPFLFRGALDTGATTINEAMKLACADALADLAMEETSDSVTTAYSGKIFRFGPEYLLPKPFDRRLMSRIPVKVAEAAMASGVARRPIEDMEAYRQRLEAFSFRTSTIMRPIFELARQQPRRILFAEGESSRVLQAMQVIVDERLCRPVLAGSSACIEQQINALGLRIRQGRDFELVDPQNNADFETDWQSCREWFVAQGVTAERAKSLVGSDYTVLSAIHLRRGIVDAMVCGVRGEFNSHLAHIQALIGSKTATGKLSTVNLVITRQGPLFITDTQIAVMPTPEHLAETVLLASRVVRRFGIEPRVALLSRSDSGSREDAEKERMKMTISLLREKSPDLEVVGAMGVDSVLAVQATDRRYTASGLSGPANLLVMPGLDAASIAFGILKQVAGAVNVGPILMGARYPVHILSYTTSVRGIVNMAAMAAVDAERRVQA